MPRKGNLFGMPCKDCGKSITRANAVYTQTSLSGRCKDCWTEHRKTIPSRISRTYEKYNLTTEEYKAKVELQLGGCAICKYPCATGIQLCIDHDHKTDTVRDLLCQRCNKVLGLVKEDEELLFAIIEYLKKWSERT